MAKLAAYGGYNIPVMDKCYLHCRNQWSNHGLEYQVMEHRKSLLGCNSCKNFITFHNVDNSTNIQHRQNTTRCKILVLDGEEIFQMYSSCFEGLGSISEPYHIKIDETVVNLGSY